MLKIKANVHRPVSAIEVNEEPLHHHEYHKELNKLIRVANKVKARED
jgi:hypothetical protein